MEKQFINKNNLSYLNNNLSQRLNLQSKSNDEKKQCIQVLLNNMKTVYKKLDINKITDNNLNKVMQSFYKYSLDLTVKDINSRTNQTKTNQTKTNQTQYNRDKEINSNRKVSYMDRPGYNNFNNENTYSNFDTSKRNQDFTQSINRRNVTYDRSEDLRSGLNARKNNNDPPEKSYEKLLQSRNIDVPSRNERPPTPDFSLDGSGAKQKKNNLDNIENFQNIKITDKSQNTNSFLSRETETINVNNNRMDGDTYHLVGSNLDSNFGNVNFGNNELSQNLPDIDESVNVSDRLKQLQSERSNFDSYNSQADNSKKQQNINDNSYLNQRNMQTNPDYQEKQMQLEDQEKQMQLENQKKQQQVQQRQKYYEQQKMEQQKQVMQQKHQNETFSNEPTNPSVYNIPNQKLYDMINNMYQNIPKNTENMNSSRQNNTRIDNVKYNQQPNIEHNKKVKHVSSVPTVDHVQDLEDNKLNKYLNELSKKQYDQLKQIQNLQEQMQQQFQNQNFSSGNNLNINDDRVKNELISKVKILTGELEQYKKANFELKKNLDEELKKKESDNEKKIRLIEKKKEEIKTEVIRLSTKHKDLEEAYNKLVRSEKQIKKIIDKNSDILSIEKSTFLINSKNFDNKSNYTYKFNKELENIKRIELISYDFPLTSNNVNNQNNKIYFKLEIDQKIENNDNDSDSEIRGSEEEEEDINEIVIPHGNYDISSLIKKINKLCRSYHIGFTYNKNTSKVTVKSESVTEQYLENKTNFIIFNKEDSILYNLGFTDNTYDGSNKYISNNSYDLRKNKYVKILFKNINNKNFAEVPIQSGKINSYYKEFTPPIGNLNNLEIEIQDNNNKIIDFCNLLHKMEFVITTSNNDKLDLAYFQKDDNLIDIEEEDIINNINSDDFDANEKVIIDANNITLSDQNPDMLIHALKGKLNEMVA